MENSTSLFSLKSPRVLILSKSFNGLYANIIIDVFDIITKKNKVTAITKCEILPDGRYRKDISSRNIGLRYLYF